MSEGVNRRVFAQVLAAGAGIPLLAGVGLAEKDDPGKPAGNASVVQTKPNDLAKTEKQPEPAELLLELVKRQFPDARLDAEVLEEIRDDLERQLRRSAVLSKFPLTNADEPAFEFVAYRADAAQKTEP